MSEVHKNNPYTNSMGFRYTKQLFLEMSYGIPEDQKVCLYTLKDRDHEGYKSLYLLFMACDDPTEWSFATQYLDGWAHWEQLCECSWFKPYVARWRKEKELRDRSLALKKIKEVAADPDHRSYYESNKYLLNSPWSPKDGKHGRGRPSKEEIKKAAVEASEAQQMAIADLDRLRNYN